MGNKFAGGKATRAEVYGLFFAAIVLIGGGVGGAFAYSASGGLNSVKKPETVSSSSVSSPTPSSLPKESPSSNEADKTQNANQQVSSQSGANIPQDQRNSWGPVLPSPPAQVIEPKIQEPYIGRATDLFYQARNYICAWDTQAMGGFGWGYDPAEPCNRQYEEYVRANCGTKDPISGQWSGIVFGQRCDEMESGTLPIAY